MGGHLKSAFAFAPDYHCLNHGSFGAAPRAVLEAQQQARDKFEAAPDIMVRYTFAKQLPGIQRWVAELVGAPESDVVLVHNATTATNTVLRGWTFAPGDKILYFSTSYAALEKAVLYVCERTGALPVKVDVHAGCSSAALLQRVEEVLNQGRVAMAMIDTINSVPTLRFPYEAMVALCRTYGCLSFVDGAHAAGCLEVNIERFKPDFFTSNLHKWAHCPRPCAVFYVAPEHQVRLHALCISHGYPAAGTRNPLPVATDVSAFQYEFSFTGTTDVSGVLAILAARDFRARLGGERAICAYQDALAQQGGTLVAQALQTEILQALEPGVGPMVNVALPLAYAPDDGTRRAELEETLWKRHKTFIPIFQYDKRWWARLSAPVYLDVRDFEYAAAALQDLVARARAPL